MSFDSDLTIVQISSALLELIVASTVFCAEGYFVEWVSLENKENQGCYIKSNGFFC